MAVGYGSPNRALRHCLPNFLGLIEELEEDLPGARIRVRPNWLLYGIEGGPLKRSVVVVVVVFAIACA